MDSIHHIYSIFQITKTFLVNLQQNSQYLLQSGLSFCLPNPPLYSQAQHLLKTKFQRELSLIPFSKE